ncbi:MAG: hypothetical protein NVSMB51_17180 [Solirubrobacteraceae bacterium]
MRVGVDARHLAGGRGVAHYTAALLGALAARYPTDQWVGFAPGRKALSPPPGLELRRSRVGGRPLFGAAALTGRPRLDRMLGSEPDVLFVPAPAPLAISREVPYVLTLHDLSFAERPADFTPYERLWHRLARIGALARGAAQVVAVSQATRESAIARWRLDPGRVHVVASGVAPPAAHSPAPPRAAPAPYLLAVGALEPRKAPDLLVRAFTRARADGLRAELVLAGEGRLAPELRAPGVSLLGRVSERRLESLYGGALALVSASWLEGYGLTPLEALARGVPPVVSDLPVYRETLGDGALRFAAGDERGLAAALLRIEREPRLRAELVAAGRRHLERLTWPRAAELTHAVLELAAGR